VFGSLPAALGLMRSIMEATPRDHYGAVGDSLLERIDQATGLPRSADRARLHRLRRRANAVLHLGVDLIGTLPELDAEDMEVEIVSMLRVLRALIEEAPPKAAWR
jgi:hypothetical protein